MEFKINVEPPYDKGCLSITAYVVDASDPEKPMLRSRLFAVNLLEANSLTISSELGQQVGDKISIKEEESKDEETDEKVQDE